jgi:hypothetical protein
MSIQDGRANSASFLEMQPEWMEMLCHVLYDDTKVVPPKPRHSPAKP